MTEPTNMSQPVWSQVEGGEPLRCGLCGEQVGKSFGEPTSEMRAMVVARCYACAAAEEAEKITKGSADA